MLLLVRCRQSMAKSKTLEEQLYRALQTAAGLLQEYDQCFPYASLESDEKRILKIEGAIARGRQKYGNT